MTTKTMKYGMEGKMVADAQKALQKAGSTIKVNGKYTIGMVSAVKAFQSASGLKADGIVGPLTWAALDAAVGPQPEPGPQLYTVTIPHLTEEQADELLEQYDAEKKAEGGGSR